jgi:hypothetical protein
MAEKKGIKKTEKKWIDVSKDCVVRLWHLEGEGSLVELLHNAGVVAVMSPSGGNMTTSPRIRGHYKIEIGESDIPAKWFRILWDGDTSDPPRHPPQPGK